MVALNARRVAGARLDDVRVEGALHQEPGVGDAPGCLLKDPDERLADRLSLLLRVGDAGQQAEESLGGPDVDQLDALGPLEGFHNLVGLPGSH